MDPLPEYTLFSQADVDNQPGRWRFVLRRTDGATPLVAEDIDPVARGERLELLAVVRGLEALDQPSHVTLLTPSVYVREGIRYGIEQWQQNDWQWESFGKMVPVKNADLWQRVQRALQFHRVDCRTWRLDPAHMPPAAPHFQRQPDHRKTADRTEHENNTPIRPRLRRLIARTWPRIVLAHRELERVACL